MLGDPRVALDGDAGVAETEEGEVRAVGFGPAALQHVLDPRLGRPHALAVELTIVVEDFCVLDHEAAHPLRPRP